MCVFTFIPKVALYFNLVTGAPSVVNGNNQYPVNNVVEKENPINPKFNGNNQYPVNNAVERETPINPEFVGNVKGN